MVDDRITQCPECGSEFDEPQPPDYVCGACGLRLALGVVLKCRVPIAVTEEEGG